MWPASASAPATSRPRPLVAPVTTILFAMAKHSFLLVAHPRPSEPLSGAGGGRVMRPSGAGRTRSGLAGRRMPRARASVAILLARTRYAHLLSDCPRRLRHDWPPAGPARIGPVFTPVSRPTSRPDTQTAPRPVGVGAGPAARASPSC